MTEALARPIEAEARIRAKNQVTLPDRIAEAMDAHQDDVLVFETDPSQPGVAVVHLVRRGFAGALTGTYGTSEDVRAFMREERVAWGE